jgi:hypothetical protein
VYLDTRIDYAIDQTKRIMAAQNDDEEEEEDIADDNDLDGIE